MSRTKVSIGKIVMRVSMWKRFATEFETTQTTATATAAIRTSKDYLHEQELNKRITVPIPAATKRTILRCHETGKWLQTPPSYVNETSLSDMEFGNALYLRYCRTPLDLRTHQRKKCMSTPSWSVDEATVWLGKCFFQRHAQLSLFLHGFGHR